MALTITEKFRMTAGGRAWRMIEVVHDSGTTKELSAVSMDLTYIEAIIGVNTRLSMVAGLSCLIDVMYISIAADHKSITWASSDICTQDITIVGW